MAGKSYDELKLLQQSLIRKAQGGSAFIGEFATAQEITALTNYVAAVTGPPLVPAHINLVDIGPMGYTDLGYLSDDGLGFSNDVSQSETTSWQSVTPTRSEITADTDTMQVVCQETKIQTIGLYTGVALSSMVPATNTGEVFIPKPTRPSTNYYRLLTVTVDGQGADEIFIARFMPKVKVTGKGDQKHGKGDDPISWDLTFTAMEDSAIGYSSAFIFGGNGWKALLEDMGFTA